MVTPLRGRLKGSGGDSESPGAFRHFGTQNGIFFAPEQKLYLFKYSL